MMPIDHRSGPTELDSRRRTGPGCRRFCYSSVGVTGRRFEVIETTYAPRPGMYLRRPFGVVVLRELDDARTARQRRGRSRHERSGRDAAVIAEESGDLTRRERESYPKRA